MPIAYGTDGKFIGKFWCMDVDSKCNSGDIKECNSQDGIYLIDVRRIQKIKPIGFCFEINGKPLKHKVTYSSGKVITTYEDEYFYDNSPLVYRLEKLSEFDYSEIMGHETNNGIVILGGGIVDNGLIPLGEVGNGLVLTTGTSTGNALVVTGTEGGNPHFFWKIVPLGTSIGNA